MKLTELLKKDALALSFEVFPPKTDTAFDSVKEATEEIAKLKHAFMSVTYGAGGGTSRYTLQIAKNIKERYGVLEAYDMTLEAALTKTMWLLGQNRDPDFFRSRFHVPVQHDILLPE